MKKIRSHILCLLYLYVILFNFTGCGQYVEPTYNEPVTVEETVSESSNLSGERDSCDWLSSIPEYRGTLYIEVNSDIPFFSNEDKKNGCI